MLRMLLLTVACLLTGCAYTSHVAPDTVTKANAHLTEIEQSRAPKPSDEEKARLAHLFVDRPEIAALATIDDEGSKLPRLRSSVPPKYPFGLWVTDTKALIKVAFVVSAEGVVEDPRIYEASDARFSQAAVDAVKAWTFYPGTRGGRRERFLFVAPIQFDGRQR